MKGAAELKPFKVLVIKEQKTQIKSILSNSYLMGYWILLYNQNMQNCEGNQR